MTAGRPDPCPVEQRPELRCGAGPLARWRFVWRELRLDPPAQAAVTRLYTLLKKFRS